MSLTSDINTTSTALSNIKSAIIAKGVTPTGNITTYANAISQISGGSPVINPLNVTPSTSAQTITAPTGVDGYSPVSVSAVTSAIDANITAGNIKKDVTILGVTGTLESGGGGGTGPMLRGNYLVYSNGMVSPIGILTGDVDPDGYPIFIPLSFNATTYSALDNGEAWCLVAENEYGTKFYWDSIQQLLTGELVTVEYYSLAAITSIGDENCDLYFDGASVIDFSGVTAFSLPYSELSSSFNDFSTTNSCDIYFNSLNTNSFVFESGECDVFGGFLVNRNSTSPATIHFPSNLQTIVSTLGGYPTFGAAPGMGICAFDLPATS